MMPLRNRALLLVLLMAACGDQEPAGSGPEQPPPQAPLGLEPWHRDFPMEVRLSQRRAGLVYDRTRRQAVEAVVANLQGNTTKEAWHAAKEFFWRAPEVAVEPLIEAMDRAYQMPAMTGVVQNTVEAMGKMGEVAFDDALRRALEHPSNAVRQAAFAALAYSGRRETVEESYRYFLQMDGKARAAWLRAARLRLGEGCVPYFTQLMGSQLPPPVHQAILKETLELPAEQAAEVLRGSWPTATGEFKAAIAGVFHAAGDVTGTLWLRERMRGGTAAEARLAVQQASRGELELLRDDILALSIHPDPAVRLAVGQVIADEPGEQITNTLVVLSEDDDWEVRSFALRALTKRGHTEQVDLLLDEVPTATGTRLQFLLQLLTASGDPRAIPVFMQRYRKAPPDEARPFLQAMAYSGSVAGFEALGEVFLAEEVRLNDPEDEEPRTTLTYVPLLMLNVRGAEEQAIELFDRLEKDDYHRRSRMLSCLASMAADRSEEAVAGRLWDAVRRVAFDRREIPQMRMLALNLMVRKALTLDDVMELRRGLAEEAPPMQRAISDFLFEYF